MTNGRRCSTCGESEEPLALVHMGHCRSPEAHAVCMNCYVDPICAACNPTDDIQKSKDNVDDDEKCKIFEEPICVQITVGILQCSVYMVGSMLIALITQGTMVTGPFPCKCDKKEDCILLNLSCSNKNKISDE